MATMMTSDGYPPSNPRGDMPYEMMQQDGMHCLRNKQTGKMVPGSCHADKADTMATMRALYANEGKSMEMEDDADFLIGNWSQVKSHPDGSVGGYLVRFGSPDLAGDVFTADTDFGFEDTIKTPVYLNHRLPLDTEDGRAVVVKAKIGEGTLTKDENGILIRAILYNRKMFKQALAEMGWSSGTAAHLVDREKKGKTKYIKSWPLGLDASLTPNPCDPDNICTLKSYAEAVKAAPLAILADELEEAESFFEEPGEAKTVWTTAYMNNLPDSAFLYVEAGGTKDSEGKTTPRSLRHFPYKDSSGKVDLAHLRNALARIPQSSLSQDVKDRVTAKAQRIAKANGVDSGSGKSFGLQQHFECVVEAIRDFAEQASELSDATKTCITRVRERLEFREAKEGTARISEANRGALTGIRLRHQAAVETMKQIGSDLETLMSVAEAKSSEPETPVGDAALRELAKFEALQLEMTLRRG